MTQLLCYLSRLSQWRCLWKFVFWSSRLRTALFSGCCALSIGPGTPGGATDNSGKHAGAYIYKYKYIIILFYSIFVLRLSTVPQYYYYYFDYYHYIAEFQRTAWLVVCVLRRVWRRDSQHFILTKCVWMSSEFPRRPKFSAWFVTWGLSAVRSPLTLPRPW